MTIEDQLLTGVPASGAGAFVDIMAGDFDDRPRSVAMVLIDQALAEGRRSGPQGTVQEAWVEDGSPAVDVGCGSGDLGTAYLQDDTRRARLVDRA